MSPVEVYMRGIPRMRRCARGPWGGLLVTSARPFLANESGIPVPALDIRRTILLEFERTALVWAVVVGYLRGGENRLGN